MLSLETTAFVTLTRQTILVASGIFLLAPLILLLFWQRWLREKRVLGLSFVTVLCGFVTVGNLLAERLASALGFGSVFLLGMFLILRQLSRTNT